MMVTSMHWTISDLVLFPEDDGNRYEIINGELYVSTTPDWRHQYVCVRISRYLDTWSEQTRSGITIAAPGVIFSKDNAVAPDILWVSRERIPFVLGADGKLHSAPDLAVELLSPGARNERRDRVAKLDLYSRRGVREYWIVDWRVGEVAVYRRHEAQLRLEATLHGVDALWSPVLPGFSIEVGQIFAGIPTDIGSGVPADEPED